MTAHAAKSRNRRILAGYSLTVFVSSALLLVLEIVAGRLVAPYVGVSLYTWTSIIGVILAGLSLGNWIGGLWADRGGDGRSVGLVLAAAGLYCMLSLLLINGLGATLQQQGASLLAASFLFAAVLFFLYFASSREALRVASKDEHTFLIVCCQVRLSAMNLDN